MVAQKALSIDDELVLADVFVEFNELAEVEPKFFTRNYKDLFDMFTPMVAKNDYDNV